MMTDPLSSSMTTPETTQIQWPIGCALKLMICGGRSRLAAIAEIPVAETGAALSAADAALDWQKAAEEIAAIKTRRRSCVRIGNVPLWFRKMSRVVRRVLMLLLLPFKRKTFPHRSSWRQPQARCDRYGW